MSVTNGVSGAINTYNSSSKNDLEKIIDNAKKGSLSEADFQVLTELVGSSKLNILQLKSLGNALSVFSGLQKNNNKEVSDLLDNVNKLIKEINKKIEEIGSVSTSVGASSGLYSDQVSLTDTFNPNDNQSNKTYLDSMKALVLAGIGEEVTSEVMAKILDDKQLRSVEGLC